MPFPIDRNSPFPDIEEAIRLLEQIPPNEPVTLEALQAVRKMEREVACRQLDELAKQLDREDAERRRLWGNKFPRVRGAKPVSVNPVKAGKPKTQRTGKAGTK